MAKSVAMERSRYRAFVRRWVRERNRKAGITAWWTPEPRLYYHVRERRSPYRRHRRHG